MLSQEVAKKIKQLEIYTRRLLSSSLVGDSRSALKGTGFEFDQLRDYQLGDDIRCIDWNSSARTQKLLVKQYMQERSRSIVLAVDVSHSGFFSSTERLRHEIMAEMAGVLSLVASYGNDRVGMLMFSDHVEEFIPLGKGLQHAHHIMAKLFTMRAHHATTSFETAAAHLMSLKERNALLVLISDFIDPHLDRTLRCLAAKYELVALRCLDAHEAQMPYRGFITVQDIETGEVATLDTRDAATMQQVLRERIEVQNNMFKKYGIDYNDSMLNKPYMHDLIKFFRRRMMY